MDLRQIPLFAAFARKLDWLGERQQVLAQNIANADTPGYRSRDLKPLSFRELLRGGGMALASTQAGHLAPRGAAAAAGRMVTPSHETAPDGNAVSIEDQMTKIAQVQLDFHATAGLYRKHIQMLKTAIGRREA